MSGSKSSKTLLKVSWVSFVSGFLGLWMSWVTVFLCPHLSLWTEFVLLFWPPFFMKRVHPCIVAQFKRKRITFFGMLPNRFRYQRFRYQKLAKISGCSRLWQAETTVHFTVHYVGWKLQWSSYPTGPKLSLVWMAGGVFIFREIVCDVLSVSLGKLTVSV